jgi:hypothetical protein
MPCARFAEPFRTFVIETATESLSLVVPTTPSAVWTVADFYRRPGD